MGLTHYTIDRVSCVERDPGGREGALAAVTPSHSYDYAIFEFLNSFVDDAYDTGDFESLDSTIIHEWMHVAFQEQTNAIWLIDEQLAPAVKTIWESALENATETLIDRVAQQIYSGLKDYF